ncbi:50S ribosomal protein L23 [Pseudobdellovibrio exovorus]|uniref:Large ribosomal subunit protein uL23 n=1 Tax=Pseudobdellovibrio exovorus JSS TaxID=1184267 RepID=M4VCB8_9BACT|nr:50S ribosomal protein L23 [Pseudobdellovibrio exovorus]AGH96125.1 50S ribosomal protein L23 [Pseudobdellovibrio exovorus JSS]
MKQIIKSPLITEKNTNLSEAGVYVFEVHREATKPEIKKAIETGFSVKVQGIRTAVCRSDMKYNKFGLSKIRRWKKAYVKLAAGQKISLFEGA